MLNVTSLFSADELASWFLCLSLWLLNDKFLLQSVRAYMTAPQEQDEQKKIGMRKEMDDLSSYAPTCDSTDYSVLKGTFQVESKLLLAQSKIPYVQDEIRWPGKKVAFGSVTVITRTMKPPKFITIVKAAKKQSLQQQQQQRARDSLSAGSSASFSTGGMVSRNSEEDDSDKFHDSLSTISTNDAPSKISSLKSISPVVAQATSFRLKDRQRYVNWKAERRSFTPATGQ